MTGILNLHTIRVLHIMFKGVLERQKNFIATFSLIVSISIFLASATQTQAQYCFDVGPYCSGGQSCEGNTCTGIFCSNFPGGCNGGTGLCNTFTISGTVFVDTDGDGFKDVGESGYNSGASRIVRLSTGSTDNTNAAGFYSFPTLNPGNYTVTLTVPVGFVATTVNPRSVSVGPNTTVNFGIRQIYTISGTVFDDFGSGNLANNNNGVKDAGENGHSGVTVTAGAAGSTVTNGSGVYTFSNVVAGTYNVTVTAPGGYSLTTPNPVSKTLPPDASNVNFGLLLPPPLCSGGLTATPGSPINPGSSTTLSVTSCTNFTPPPVWNPDADGNIPPPTISGQTDTPTSSTITWTAPLCPASQIKYKPQVVVSGPAGNTTYSTNITVPATYSVTVNVRSVSNTGSCAPGDGAAYNDGAGGGAHLNLTGGSVNQSPTTDPGTGQATFTCLPTGNYQLTVSIPSGYTLTGTNVDGVQSFPGSNPISLNSLAANATTTFCIAPINPWFQTDKGDARFLNLTNPVPSGKLGSTDATYPGIFYSSNSNVSVGFGAASVKNWVINNEYSYNADTENRNGGMSYDFYKSKASQLGTTITQIDPNTFNQAQITGSGVYEAPGDLTINLYNHVNGRRVVLLVDGNVTLNAPISIPQNQGVFILAAKGNITVAKAVGVAFNTDYVLATSNTHSLDGYYTAQGSVILDGDTCPDGTTADLRLNVGGALIANALKPFATTGTGTIQNKRSICANSTAYPSLFIASRPDFITQLTDFYKTSYTKWQEVNP